MFAPWSVWEEQQFQLLPLFNRWKCWPERRRKRAIREKKRPGDETHRASSQLPPVSPHRHLITGGKKQKKEGEEQLPRNKIKAARLDGWMDACVDSARGIHRWVVLVRATRANATCTCLSFDKKGRKQKKRETTGVRNYYTHTHTDQTLFFFSFSYMLDSYLFGFLPLGNFLYLTFRSFFRLSSTREIRQRNVFSFLFFGFVLF